MKFWPSLLLKSVKGWHSGLAVAATGIFYVVLLVGLFIPAFVDDILYPMLDSRAGYDGWQSITTWPQCAQNFATPIPWVLLPGRAIAWFIHVATNGFFTMRAIAIGVLLGWIAYFVYFLKRYVFENQPVLYIIGGVLSFIGIGTLPFATLLNRPETAMIWAITFYISLPFFIQHHKSVSFSRVLLLAVVFFLVTSWFTSAHAKAQLYVPVVILAAAWICTWHKGIGYVLLGITVFTFYQSWENFWQLKITCFGSKEVAGLWENAALFPSLLLGNTSSFWKGLLFNFSRTYEYIQWISYHPPLRWLPPFQSDFLHGIADWLLILIMYSATLISAMCAVLMCYYAVTRRDWQHPAFILSLALWGAAIGQLGLQSDKYFYNTGLIWGTMLLGGLLAFIYQQRYRPDGIRWLRYMIIGIMSASLVSQAILLTTYIPATIRGMITADANLGVINGVWPLISPWHYQEREIQIKNSADACHIATDNTSTHVAIDLPTYFTFKTSYQPFRLAFRFHEFDQPERLLAFLYDRDSSGLVMLCNSLPPAVRAIARQENGVCCISREQIDESLRRP